MLGMWDIGYMGYALDVECSRYGVTVNVECLRWERCGTWSVRDAGCLGCGMFDGRNVYNVGYLKCGMFGM